MKVNKIQMYRKAIKKTQKDFAELLNLSVDGYSKKERRISQFTESEIKELLKLFKSYDKNLTAEDIFL
nr:helix-turn-helix transcriptional regulator [uncultured Granulicatella sp.]